MEALLVKKGGLAGLYGLLELTLVIAAIFAAFAGGVYCGMGMAKEAQEAVVIEREEPKVEW